MAQMKERMAALSSRVGEVEQEAETARKELIKTEEMNSKYQRDIREVRSSVLCTSYTLPVSSQIPIQADRDQWIWKSKVSNDKSSCT